MHIVQRPALEVRRRACVGDEYTAKKGTRRVQRVVFTDESDGVFENQREAYYECYATRRVERWEAPKINALISRQGEE